MSTRQPDGNVRSILVPTDFSENADTAIAYAIGIAAAHGASITLLHVADVVTLSNLPFAIQEEITRTLERLESTVRAAGVAATSVKRCGAAWQKIAGEAEEHDLVVIGARGLTKHPERFLGLGGTADRVLRAAPVPVLTVHATDKLDDRPPRRIVLPTDFSDGAALALETVINLCKPTPEFKLDVKLVHAWMPLVDYEWAFAGAPAVNPLDGTEDQARSVLESLADEVRSDAVEITPIVRAGPAAQVIEDVAELHKAELIALSTHGRSGVTRWILGSVAERVAHRSTCPVLSVRRRAGRKASGEPAAEAVADK